MEVMKEHAPEVADAFQAMRKSLAQSGPLPPHIQELIVCGAFVVNNQQGSFMTHGRRALDGGATPEMLRHAVLVTLGASATFSQVTAGLSWADALTRG
jgi:alkylhydroperoxidase/carboxymuconolactone decarboxylase family protein YurZ